MGNCRNVLIEASTGVKPFGTTYHAIQMVVTAMDALAYMMTGRPHFLPGGSTTSSGGPHAYAPGERWDPDRLKR